MMPGETGFVEERKVGFCEKVRNRLIRALGGIGSEDLINVVVADSVLDRDIEWYGESGAIDRMKLEFRDMIAEELYGNGIIEYTEVFNRFFGRSLIGKIVVVNKEALSRLDERRQKKEGQT